MIVTKEELEQIRTDCYQPDKECPDCKYDIEDDCTFDVKGLIRDIESRPDPLALLEAWRIWALSRNEFSHLRWNEENEILTNLRTNPAAVREQGIKDGWWKG